ncbi:MAG: protein CapI, partial [Rhodocyclaceae bacterium]|nr:protein CapI [Rhodocyclaceae bacterium]
IDRPAEPNPSFIVDAPDPATSWAPYRVFNIGNQDSVELMDYIAALEKALGKEAQKNFLPMQAGDVPATSADTAELRAHTGFAPAMPVEEGVRRFVEWYRAYFKV